MRGLFIFFLILGVASCVEPINLGIPGSGGTLVVDGWITNQPGPYLVKLSRSVPYVDGVIKTFSTPEKGAVITITDDLGNVENLTETTTPGSYLTNSLLGVPGRSYRLDFKTTKGGNYTSNFEKLMPVPPLVEIVTEYKITETLIINANGSPRTQRTENFLIYAVVNDPPEEKNYYRWTSDGIFEFFAINDDPLKHHCWAPTQGRLESQIEVTDDLDFNGQKYRQQIGIFPYDKPTMYLVHTRQRSLSSGGYEFLRQIRNQQTSTGSLFDPPPTGIAGNIHNINNDSEIVLGYFGASGETDSHLLVNRFAESGYGNPSRYVQPKGGDCRTQELNATNIKPPYF